MHASLLNFATLERRTAGRPRRARTSDGGARLAEALRLVRRARHCRHRRMFFESHRLSARPLPSPLAATTEVVSGLLIALGLLGPVGPALMLSVMIVAAVSVHWQNGLFATSNGIEVALFYGTAAVGLALTGFGATRSTPCTGCNRLYTPTRASSPSRSVPSAASATCSRDVQSRRHSERRTWKSGSTRSPSARRIASRASVSAEQRLADLIEEMELADQVGLDVFGVGEHHRPDFVVSSPAVVLAAAAARTKRIRLTSAVYGAQLRRSGARLPGLRHARPPLRRARGDHGGTRLVHRVVPAVRLRPRRLRRAVRREARAAARAARAASG